MRTHRFIKSSKQSLQRFLATPLLCTFLKTRKQRQVLLYTLDIFSFVLSIYLAMVIRFDSWFPIENIIEYSWQIIGLILIKCLFFHILSIRHYVLRYTGIELVLVLLQAVLASSIVAIALSYISGFWPLPRSILIIDGLLTLALTISTRLSIRDLVRYLARNSHDDNSFIDPIRVLVYGAGAAGTELLQALAGSRKYQVIGFLDDNPELQRRAMVHGVKVFPSSALAQLDEDDLFDMVILAMPSVDRTIRRSIVERLQKLSISVKTVPSLEELLSEPVAIQQIRDIDIADLLGREEVAPDLALLQQHVTGRTVLVTGAGGSIGSEICRQVAQQQPKCLVLYELNEFSLYQIEQELIESYPHLDYVACLGNVMDAEHLSATLQQYNVETIYHTAAYKHVPLVEKNLAKGIENNVKGTMTAALCAIDCRVKNFVLISTDKAVRPTNIMGASKRVTELIVQALAAQPEHSTCFAIVRFGNVLNSSGSVVPLFRKQIAQRKPITLTHPDITRYFMSIPEAARLVIQAGALATGGEVFLLDMGEPVRIYDLAHQMIHLSGLTPGQDIEIRITGLRPGEKLYEELLIAGDNIERTQHPKIFCAHEYFFPWHDLIPQIELLFKSVRASDIQTTVDQLRALVPEYTPKELSTKYEPEVLAPEKMSNKDQDSVETAPKSQFDFNVQGIFDAGIFHSTN